MLARSNKESKLNASRSTHYDISRCRHDRGDFSTFRLAQSGENCPANLRRTLIEPLTTNETDRAFQKDILESRKNQRDRFNFEATDMRRDSYRER
jgi:hypothetical protein